MATGPHPIVPPCFTAVDRAASAAHAEADWRALCTVLGARLPLTDATRQELVQLAIEARTWIPTARLAEIDAARLAEARAST